MKHITFLFTAVTLFCGLVFSSPVHAIKKCQDANGKWHYGDVAVAQCNNSKVTTLNDRGFIEDQKDAPKTAEQLQKEKEIEEKMKAKLAREQAEEDERNRILSIYETEADIDRQRDNQIDSVVGNIAVHKAYLKSVGGRVERLKERGTKLTGVAKDLNIERIAEAQERIKESSVELEKLMEQKASIIERFAYEKKTYRELKNQS